MKRGDLLRRRGRAPFLPLYFAMPSYLRRQVSVASIHATICLLSLILAAHLTDSGLQAFAMGLVLPGAGFLHWAGEGQVLVALLALGGALLLFALAVVVWFAT